MLCESESPLCGVAGLAAALPGREEQIGQLRMLLAPAGLSTIADNRLGTPLDSSLDTSPDTSLMLDTPPALFLSGPPSSGKSRVVSGLLECVAPSRTAMVDCVECHTPRLLFERALNGLAKCSPSMKNDFNSYARCDSLADFVRLLITLLDSDQERGTRYLVFDRADRLRDMPPTLFPALTRLAELTSHSICVIFLANINVEKFFARTGCHDPLTIYFPAYSKQQLANIFLLKCPVDEDTAFFSRFVQYFLGTFYNSCTDLNELNHLWPLLFEKYRCPVIDGLCLKSDSAFLWKNIEKDLKGSLDKLFLRELTVAEFQTKTLAVDLQRALESDISFPRFVNFLLISSYLASYNPARLDQRYFCRGVAAAKTKKGKKRKIKGKDTMKQLLIGPKSFAVERMLAIFYSVMRERSHDSISGVDVQAQIANLINLKLLVRMSSLDKLETMKCKCNVGFSFVSKIAKKEHFDLQTYLYDFQ